MDHPPNQDHQSHRKYRNKVAKDKIRMKEQQRYLRKVDQNKKAETNVKDKAKEIQEEKKEENVAAVNSHVGQDFVSTELQMENGNELGKNELKLDETLDKKNKHKENEAGYTVSHDMQSSGPQQVSASPAVNNDDVVEEHYIFRLKKKNPRFPHAKFYCRLCNYHLDTLSLCTKHWKERRHSKLEETKHNQKEIESIEAPSKSHADALTILLETTVSKCSLSEDDLINRACITDRVQQVLLKIMPDVKVNLYGSSLSGFGFHDSDVNLNIEAPEGAVPSQTLVKAWDVLNPADAYFEDVQSDFEGRFPCIRFKDKNSGLRCELSTGSVSAFKTSKLLCEYRQFDPRVHFLAMALRYWARLCGVDSQSDGSMPAYSFVLMTIFFLQHCNPPVVPVLQEGETLKERNTDMLGELWIKMLRFYTVETAIEEMVISVRKRQPVSREELKIPNRRLAIEDPVAVNKKNIAKSLSSNIVFEYFFDRLQDALLYFGKPQKAACANKNDANSAPIKPKTSRQQDVISDKQEQSSCEDTGEKDGDALCNVDPQISCYSLKQCVDKSAPAGSQMISKDKDMVTISEDIVNSSLTNLHFNIENNLAVKSPCSKSQTKEDTLVDSPVLCSERETSTSNICDSYSAEACKEEDVQHNQFGQNECHNVDIETNDQETDPFKSQDFRFVFDKNILTGGKKVMIVCNACGKEGHKVAQCPDDTLPNLVTLPPMEKGFLKRIDALCKYVEDKFSLKDWTITERDKAVLSYENIIRQNGYRDATLNLFGSSRNGFGFLNSDMDICLKFKSHRNAEDLNIPVIIEDLAKQLKRHSNLQHVIPISTAKVPIVKFVDPYMHLDVDISLYNCLAQANTHMLYMYSKIDPRVRQLVYTAKVFAKTCDIGDASKGSLSSYAYTLMTIFFLQQRKPPVLPVLQEMYDGKDKPEDIVEGWNAWFLADLKKVFQVWKSCNRESVGELWVGFLRFFTEEFNSKKHVVCIRQHKLLTRFEKMWTGAARGFAIEDPFDLDHNLGSGVSRKMATFIMHVFIKAREHFGTSKKIVGVRNDFVYFFDEYILTGGEAPPNDRCCKVCGKIGHFLKDCPHRKGHKDIGKGKDKEEEAKKKKDALKRDTADVRPQDKPNGVQKTVPKSGNKIEVNSVQTSESVREAVHVPTSTSPVTSRVMTQTTSKVIPVQTTVYYPQVNEKHEETIEDTWKQHQEDRKQQRKQDTKRRSKSESGNKKTPVSMTGQSKFQDHSANVSILIHPGQSNSSKQQNVSVQPEQMQSMKSSKIMTQPSDSTMHYPQPFQTSHSELASGNNSAAINVPDVQRVLHPDHDKWQQHEVQATPMRPPVLPHGSPSQRLQQDHQMEPRHLHHQQFMQQQQQKVWQPQPQQQHQPQQHYQQQPQQQQQQQRHYQQQPHQQQQQQQHQQKHQQQPHHQQQQHQQQHQQKTFWHQNQWPQQQQQQWHQQQKQHKQQSQHKQWQQHLFQHQQHSQQPIQQLQSVEPQPMPEHNVTGSQGFSLAKFSQLANIQDCHRDLPPNETSMTLQDVEALQQKKQQLQHQDQPRLTGPPILSQQYSSSLDQMPPSPHSPFMMTNTPTTPTKMHGSPGNLHGPVASPPGLTPSSPEYGVSQGVVWEPFGSPGKWPMSVNQSQPGVYAVNSPFTGMTEENILGSALLQGVSMLQNSEGGEVLGSPVHLNSASSLSPGHNSTMSHHGVSHHGYIQK